MTLKLDSHFVAFIDILGFSEMVRSDCESTDSPKYLELLYNSHVRASALFAKDLDSGLIQFSDSIVFSKPFKIETLAGFLDSIGEWQQTLLLDGLLCRGGVAFDKHFVKDKFLFSKAMIDAYLLESSKAHFPRIIVSDDLLQLVSSQVSLDSLRLRCEDDGATFIDFLRYDNAQTKKQLIESIEMLTRSANKSNSAVQEKLRWLASYADHVLETKIATPQFLPIMGG